MVTVAGLAFPPYTIFHASLGYIIVCIGLAAMITRIVILCSKSDLNRDKWRRIHRICGRAWLMSTYFMPLTAIWVKPWDMDWDIIAFFIFSMYATIVGGYVCIKIRAVSTNMWAKRLLKGFHAFFMIYSWVMLVGAGISFPFRAVNRVYAQNNTST